MTEAKLATRTGAAADAQIGAFIARREKRNAGTSPAQVRALLWAESERRHKADTRERNRWEWIRFFDRMAASHAALAERYRERAEKLLEEGAASWRGA